jgi:general secretion pathway protein F
VKLCYKGLPQGGGDIFKGEIEARSEREALRTLATEGVIVTEISEIVAKTSNRFQRSLSRQEVVLALFELSTMLKSGVSIAEAIESQSQAHYHPELNVFFKSVNRSLRGGEALGPAMKNTSLELPDYLFQLVNSGELSGNLAECLSRGVEQLEYDLDIATKFRSALIYPGVLLLTGMLAVGLIFVLVVPKFSHLLDRADDTFIISWSTSQSSGCGFLKQS